MAKVAVRPMISMMNQMKRSMRRPRYNFNLVQRPWQIQPFMVAPVLPGETMKNLLLQSRAVTKPIKSALIGWWAEYYFFYVKFRDMDYFNEDQAWQAMFLDAEADMSAKNSAAAVPHYHGHASYPNYSLECLKPVVERWFRDEGEAWNSNLIDSLPVASINQNNFMDSIRAAADFTTTDLNVDLDASGTITASEVERARHLYDLLQVGDLSSMTFEDYLRTYGVSVQDEEASHKPELLRYIRQWTYPSNTVEPTTGVPSSACSWSIAERADKDRLFKEPGFIFGVSVFRPKVYLSRLTGSAVDALKSAMHWLPAVLADEAHYSLINTPDNHFLGDNTDANGAWWDVKDLFMYGDQYINHAVTANLNPVALPTVAYQHRYASSTDADALFTAAAPANTISQDGVCNLSIATRLSDTSPRHTDVA